MGNLFALCTAMGWGCLPRARSLVNDRVFGYCSGIAFQGTTWDLGMIFDSRKMAPDGSTILNLEFVRRR